MIIQDYHMHCTPYSPDAHDSMLDMARAARSAGVTHICFTNHVDDCALLAEDSITEANPRFDDWDEEYRELNSVKKELPDLSICFGIEVSSPHYMPERGREIYEHENIEFVIGSIHNLRGMEDFYFFPYSEVPDMAPYVERYIDENIELVKSGLCDVVGHIGYMLKYMARDGYSFDMMRFEDRLRELFRLAVERGIGIELNTSGLYAKYAEFIPNKPVLTLYRECGGEIITIGSDSHRVSRAGSGIKDGYALLKECGFKYAALYSEHKPEFYKI